jgi:hypothetical protein
MLTRKQKKATNVYGVVYQVTQLTVQLRKQKVFSLNIFTVYVKQDILTKTKL